MSTTYPPETNDNRVTSWLPLTTSWVDFSDCNGLYILYDSVGFASAITSTRTLSNSKILYDPDLETQTRFRICDPLLATAFIPGSACLPREVITWHAQFSENASFYSVKTPKNDTVFSLLPLICPNSWSTVATFIKSSISIQIMCCSS